MRIKDVIKSFIEERGTVYRSDIIRHMREQGVERTTTNPLLWQLENEDGVIEHDGCEYRIADDEPWDWCNGDDGL